MELSISILREKLRNGFRSEQFQSIEDDDESVQSLLNTVWRQSDLSSSTDFNKEVVDAWDTKRGSKLSIPQLDDNGNLYRVIFQINQQLDEEKEDDSDFDPSKYNILAELPYDVFLQTILDNKIRGKELLSLCVSNPKINQKCNHRDQNLFRRLLQIEYQIEDSEIRENLNPRETYFKLGQPPIWTFGDGEFGQLGLGDRKNQAVPTQIPNIRGVKQISCGSRHTVFIDQDNRVWTFGDGRYGQLGLGDQNYRSIPTRILNIPRVKQISCGGFHSIFIDIEGRLWSFGLGGSGQLGLGDDNNQSIPIRIRNIPKVKQISCGGNHTAFIDKDDRVFTFGLGIDGQLGLGDQRGRSVPTWILRIPKVKQISCGYEHTAFIDHEGGVWTFGHGGEGRLGFGDQNHRSVPTQIFFNIPKAKQISCGGVHTAFIDHEGGVWTFGRGEAGRLGLDDQYFRVVPTQIPEFRGVKQISCGYSHTAFIDQDDLVRTFGYGGFGRLGLGDQNNRSVPTLIPNFRGVKQISCGGNHSAFLK